MKISRQIELFSHSKTCNFCEADIYLSTRRRYMNAFSKAAIYERWHIMLKYSQISFETRDFSPSNSYYMGEEPQRFPEKGVSRIGRHTDHCPVSGLHLSPHIPEPAGLEAGSKAESGRGVPDRIPSFSKPCLEP